MHLPSADFTSHSVTSLSLFQSDGNVKKCGMATTNVRSAAAELARRIKSSRIDPAQLDEADRPPSDKPPGYAQALMSEKPASIERTARLEPADWDLIEEALEHYAGDVSG